MDLAKQIIDSQHSVKGTMRLPQQAVHQVLCATHLEYLQKHSQLIDLEINDIICPITQFTFNNSKIDIPKQSQLKQYAEQHNAIAVLCDKLKELINFYKATQNHEQPSSLVKTNPIRVLRTLIPDSSSPIEHLRFVIQNRRYPAHVPYMSSFPFIEPISKLMIQEEQEANISQFASEYQFDNPYQDYIANTTIDFKIEQKLEDQQCQSLGNQRDSNIQNSSHKQIYEYLYLHDKQIDNRIEENVQQLDKLIQNLTSPYTIQILQTITDKKIQQMYLNIIMNKILFKPINDKENFMEFVDLLNRQESISVLIIEENESYYGETSAICFYFEFKLFVVDCRKLCQYIYKLRQFFVSQSITKIMWNMKQAVLGLQRDFRLYINNAIDVKLICDYLSNTNLSYQQLLSSFGINEYQKSDNQLQNQEYFKQQLCFLPSILLQYSEKLTLTDIANLQKSHQDILCKSYNQFLNEQNQDYFQKLDSAVDISQLKNVFIQLFADTIQRMRNQRKTTLSEQQIRNVNELPEIQEYKSFIPQLEQLIQEYYQYAQNKGMFNKTKNVLKPSIKKLGVLNSSVWHTNLNQLLTEKNFISSQQDNGNRLNSETDNTSTVEKSNIINTAHKFEQHCTANLEDILKLYVKK